jgi:hypothetical protein
VRYGLADRQRGAEQIVAWRRDHPSIPPGRRLRETTALAVDDRMAVVTTLFHYPADAGKGGPRPPPREGRQSLDLGAFRTRLADRRGPRVVVRRRMSAVPGMSPTGAVETDSPKPADLDY